MDAWVKKAYDNWNQVVEYDGKSLLNFKQIKKSSSSLIDLPVGPVSYPSSSDNQLPPQRMPTSLSSEPSVDQSILIGGKHYLLSDFLFTSFLCVRTCEYFVVADWLE